MTAHPFRTTLLSCVAFLAGACATATGPSSEEDIVSSEEVVVETEEMSPSRAMHERAIVLDTHLDTPANLVLPGFDIEIYDSYVKVRHSTSKLRHSTSQSQNSTPEPRHSM